MLWLLPHRRGVAPRQGRPARHGLGAVFLVDFLLWRPAARSCGARPPLPRDVRCRRRSWPGGALFRFNIYLVAFNPGDDWTYFPSLAEVLITVGIVAAELRLQGDRQDGAGAARPPIPRRRGATMGQRITIDPITRIEGHLRIDVEVDGGRSPKPGPPGQMWRGIEVILKGRDPRDAWVFAQRFCGVCTTVHAIASMRAVEHALKVEVPLNAQYIRNMMIAPHSVQDHIVHFYHLSALDWVDVVSALKADPADAAKIARVAVGLAGQQRPGDAGGQGQAGRLRGRRETRDLRQRLLGPPGDEAAAGGQPAGRRPLPPGAGVPAQGQPDRHAARQQDPQHPEPRGRRRGQRDQPGQLRPRSTWRSSTSSRTSSTRSGPS